MADSTLVDEIERRLRAALETSTGFGDDATKTAYLSRLFRKYDTDASGFLNFDEFNAAMVRLNFVGVQAAVEGLFDRYDKDGTGLVAYDEFAAMVVGILPNVSGDPESRSAVDRVRRAIASRGGMNGIRTIGKLFRTLADGSSMLHKKDLKEGLLNWGVALSDKDLETVISAFDVSGDGSITFDEFLRGIRGGINKRRRELVSLAFDVLDKDHSGEVTIEDVAAAYDVSQHPDVKAGKTTPKDVLSEFMSQWDKGVKDGKITRDEFLEYYKDVSASIDDDDYFELVIRNAWHISGGEGWAANTSCRRVLVEHSDGSQEVVEIKNDIGIKVDDLTAMRKRLVEQGVKDIARISLAD